MFRVLFAENSVFRRYVPVNAEATVKYANASVRFRVVELIALILEHRRLAQHGKTMRKPFRDKELPVVVLGQFNGYMLSVCRRSFPNINGNIQHFTPYTSHNFACVYGGRWKCRPRITPYDDMLSLS